MGVMTIASCVATVVVRDRAAVLVIWLLVSVLTAAFCGHALTSLRIVAHMA